MNKLAVPLSIALCPGFLAAQPIVDIGLFPNATSDTLEVRLVPSGDFGGLISSLTFTIRWPDASPATLGTGAELCAGVYPIPTPVELSGGYQYKTYNAFGLTLLSDEGCPMVAGEEFVILRLPVLNNDGLGQFRIVNDPWTSANNRNYYIGLGGLERTGVILTDLDPGPGNGVLHGLRFLDGNADCQMGLEPGIPYRVMQLSPGPISFITGTDGNYEVAAPAGDYTLMQSLEAGLHAACPPSSSVPVTITDGGSASLQLANTGDALVEVEVQLITDLPVLGFTYPAYILVRNNGFANSGPVAVYFLVGAEVEYVNAFPSPDEVDGNWLEWYIDDVPALSTTMIRVTLEVPPQTALLGDPVVHTASIAPGMDSDLSNNSTSISETIVGSFDPNDKTAWTAHGINPVHYIIDQDDWITYRIRFQNTGTYPAGMVVITDTLDEDLDMLTFEQGPASHAFDVRFLPGRVVEWTFAPIFLPDSGANEAASHGLVSYRIRPGQLLSAGAVIANTANIHFDFNPPVITEPSVLTAEFSTGLRQPAAGEALRVYPNPVSSLLQISLTLRVTSLRIRAGDGRLVMVRTNMGGLSAVDVQDLPSGAYAVEAVTNEGTVHRARFIKQ